MLNPHSIQPQSSLAHPARLKPQRVYGQPQLLSSAVPQQHPPSPIPNQPQPSFLALSPGPVGNASLADLDDATCFPRRKTIQEQLAEIDAMPDADLAFLVPPPSAQQPPPEPGPSSQPSAALPTSLAHSVASSRLHDSPPSSMPRTPLDFSPFAARRPKRLRVSDSDSEVEADLDSARGLPKRVQTCASDDDSLPTFEQALADEQALALAEARSALALEPATRSPKQHPPLIHSDISDAESEPTPQPKSKKSKGLSKKDKEETQRTIALCERQRAAKLIGSCRAPNTRLDDIVTKATAATSAQYSSAASHATLITSSSVTDKKGSNLTALALDAHQSSRAASHSLTSPIDEFPAVDEAVHDDDDVDDKLLPDLDEVFSAPRPRIDAEAAKKQAWLAQLRQTRVQHPGPSRSGDSDSDDAELDIVGQPKPTRLVHPSPKDVLAARSMARRTVKRPSLPLKALFGSVDDRAKPDGQHSKQDIMKGLLQRSAVEGALLREQKRAEFVERGGKLARETASRVAPDSVDLKAILKKNEEEGVDPEDAVDCDWEEEIELSGDDDDDEEEGEQGSSSTDEDEQAGGEGSSVTEEVQPAAEEDLETVGEERGVARVTRARSSTNSPTSSMSTDMPHPGQSSRKFAPATSPTPKTPITDSPRPEGAPASPAMSSSSIDLPGFNLKVERSGRRSVTAIGEDLDEDLPGFGPAPNSAGFSGSLGGLSQFEQSGCSDKQAGQAGFSQLFGDDEQLGFTHPPPALKQAEPGRDAQDGAEELGGSCVLPEVHVLPEERERDMVMMMLGVQKRSMEEEEHEPTQYVNHRGLLTQHKPSLHASMLPESPLMSQDLMARTPFALRKDHLSEPSCEDDQADDESRSPCGGRDFDVAESPSARDRMKSARPVKDAFAAVMEGGKKSTRGWGAGRLFLADQADESDDELGGGPGGQLEEEDESGSEAGQAELAGLVDDGADERDEATRLAGDEAMQALALQHQQEAEARQADHIARLVAGKIRIKQARGRGDGGISESDSEDDEEEEWVKANKRAQEFAAKKKKMAIHRLAEKHAPFFKSYEEGTSQWVDEDDLACLQPEEPKASGGESDNEEDDEYEEVMFERASRHRSSYSRVRPREEVAGDGSEESEETEGQGAKAPRVNLLSSSPVKLPPLKISDPMVKRAGGMGGPSKSAHADLDMMYNWKQAAELTERQKQGVAELVGEERAGERRGAGKSSSITYQNLEQQRAQKKAKDLLEGSVGEGGGSKGKGGKGKSGGDEKGVGVGRLARLKGSKK